MLSKFVSWKKAFRSFGTKVTFLTWRHLCGMLVSSENLMLVVLPFAFNNVFGNLNYSICCDMLFMSYSSGGIHFMSSFLFHGNVTVKHLQLLTQEKGNSPQSLGNTVAKLWRVLQGYWHCLHCCRASDYFCLVGVLSSFLKNDFNYNTLMCICSVQILFL